MKIEKITLCNLASIAGEQVIDFTVEPLRSAGLFAITGDTGAGKSTILDALCLALYDEAPRLSGVEKNDRNATLAAPAGDNGPKALQPDNTRNILRRGAAEGYAEVEFAAADGARYRARWYVRVKRTGNYDDVVRTLERLAPKRETFDTRRIQPLLNDIIGLDYGQFSRTVMLAQGSFSNFIRARREEKSALLEKLTGTGLYRDISRQIHLLTAEARRRWDDFESQLKGVMRDRLEDDERTALGEERQRLETALAHVRQTLDSIRRQQEWLEEYARLTAALRDAEQTEAEARRTYEALRSDELRLRRYDDVLCVQPLFQEIVQRGADIAKSRQEEEAAGKALGDARESLRRLAATLQAAQDRVADIGKRHQARRPDINRGYALAGEIREARTQLAGWERQLDEARAALLRSQAALRAGREQADGVRREVERHSLRHQALAVHKRMFEKYDLVKDRLATLDTERRRRGEYRKQLAVRLAQQESLSASVARLEEKLQQGQARLNTLRSELLLHRQANRGHDGGELQRRFADNSQRCQQLRQAQVLWTNIAAAYAEISEKNARCNRMTVELQQKKAEAVRLQHEWEVTDAAYRRLSVSYTLSQSRDILKLRQQLQEGTACPVCGAMHHPYHTETEREMGKLLSTLEKEYEEMGAELAAKSARLAALREEYAAGLAALEAERRSLAETERVQSDSVARWAEFAPLDASFRDCSPSVNSDARRVMLGQLLESTARAAEEAERDWCEFNTHQESINTLSRDIETLSAQMNDDRTSLEKLRTDAGIAAAAAEELQRNVDRADRGVRQYYSDLTEVLTISGWTAEWERNPEGFRTHLSDLYNEWTATCSSLEACSQRETLLRKDLKATEEKVGEDERTLAARRESRSAVAESLAAKEQELRKLFGDSSPEAETERYQVLTEEARTAEKRAREQHDAAIASVSHLEGRLKNLQATRTADEALLRTRRMELDTWILRFNGDHAPLLFSELERIFGATCDWNALRRTLDDRRTAAHLARHRLLAAQEALHRWQARPERPAAPDDPAAAATLRAEAEAARAATDDTAARLALTAGRLQAHDNCLRNASALEAGRREAEADYREWSRLDEMLGSADGKKFRNLAQSYTFGSLVERANHHLRQLCPRYELRNKPGTLDLEILDRDMFDQRRYVSSLSGGETFVVSLALALGLASLSGKGLHIGSLFIDEGFGNLDRASLEMVMAALSNLEHTQGRKVGVISHTEQIQSQISPQIHVVKNAAGGRSKIEIM